MNLHTGTGCLVSPEGSWLDVEISARDADGTCHADPLDRRGDPFEWIGCSLTARGCLSCHRRGKPTQRIADSQPCFVPDLAPTGRAVR